MTRAERRQYGKYIICRAVSLKSSLFFTNLHLLISFDIMVKLLSSVLYGLALIPSTLAQEEFSEYSPLEQELWKRTVNQTEFSACQAIKNATTSPLLQPNTVFLPTSPNNKHYMITSSQASTCIFTPRTAQDLAAAVKIIGDRRIRFAISCSGHASNQGFSSTPGIHISMKGFQSVTVSANNDYVDIGGGIAWSDVYAALDSSTVNVVGGRVPGPGIGGFVTGGGGYSWLTNQYGLTGDTLLSVDMVLPNGTITTVSEATNPELFWAIKGGGNRFGFIYSFRLRAVPRPAQVYADTKIMPAGGSNTQAFLDAIADFSANNQDPKAQIIPTINYLLGIPTNILLAFYDGIPSYDPFSMFNQTMKTQSFNSFVQSLGISNIQANQRGTFNTVSLESYTPAILAQIANQTEFWGKQSLLNSGTFISYDVEPFLNYSQYAKDAAWPHTNNALPLNLYFSWTNPLSDGFWRNAILESSRVIRETARAEGQKVGDLLLYPNYAMKEGNSVESLYGGGGNVERIEAIRRRIDPVSFSILSPVYYVRCREQGVLLTLRIGRMISCS